MVRSGFSFIVGSSVSYINLALQRRVHANVSPYFLCMFGGVWWDGGPSGRGLLSSDWPLSGQAGLFTCACIEAVVCLLLQVCLQECC